MLSLLESPYARKMPRKVVSGPDYDDDYDEYDEYDDDDDDEYDETRYGNNTPVMTGKGILPNLLALFISSVKRGKWSLELLYTAIPSEMCLFFHKSCSIAQINVCPAD